MIWQNLPFSPYIYMDIYIFSPYICGYIIYTHIYIYMYTCKVYNIHITYTHIYITADPNNAILYLNSSYWLRHYWKQVMFGGWIHCTCVTFVVVDCTDLTHNDLCRQVGVDRVIAWGSLTVSALSLKWQEVWFKQILFQAYSFYTTLICRCLPQEVSK